MTSTVLRNQAIKLQLSDCKCKISSLISWTLPTNLPVLKCLCKMGVCVGVCVCCVLHSRRTNFSWKGNGSQMFVFQTKEKKLKNSNSQVFVYHLTWSSLSQNFLLSEKFFSPVNIAFIKRSHWSLVDFVTRGTSLASLLYCVNCFVWTTEKIHKGPLAICWFVCIGF